MAAWRRSPEQKNTEKLTKGSDGPKESKMVLDRFSVQGN